MHGTIAEMKKYTLLCQENFFQLYLSNISSYLIIKIILNDPYITVYIMSKI